MINYNHYEDATLLIKMLSDTSLRHYSDKLQKAMEEGATGTEIFMALRWNLEKLLEEEDCKDFVRVKANRLWDEIDKALQ